MKPLMITVGACLALFSISLTVLLLVGFHDYRRVGEDNRALQADLQDANVRLGELEKGRDSLTGELEARRSEVQDLTAKLTEAAAANSKTNDAAALAVQPRPYQVPAFLGNDYLGLAWVVPRNLSRDPKTGRVTFEPVLLLDPGWRRAFTETATEVVEQPAAPSYAAVYNYYSQWPWILVPNERRHRTNAMTRINPPPPPKALPRSPRTTDAWLPVGASRPLMAPTRQSGGNASVNSSSDPSMFATPQGVLRTSLPR